MPKAGPTSMPIASTRSAPHHRVLRRPLVRYRSLSGRGLPHPEEPGLASAVRKLFRRHAGRGAWIQGMVHQRPPHKVPYPAAKQSLRLEQRKPRNERPAFYRGAAFHLCHPDDKKQLAHYLTTQSNVIAKVEGGSRMVNFGNWIKFIRRVD